MKIGYTGLESAGKSLLLANSLLEVLGRNKRWKKKYNFTRLIYTNLKLSDKHYDPEYIRYFRDTDEIVGLTGCDIFFDEISTYFSALKKEPLPIRTNQWLRQGAKQGVHIYFTAQEFHDVHLDFRRRCFAVYSVSKFMGSQRSGQNMPPVKNIWGLITIKTIDIHPYNELQPRHLSVFPSFFLITRDICSVFDTNQTIDPRKEYLLEHIEKYCKTCKKRYVVHR